VTPLSCAELADLAVAADHFLVDSLTKYCKHELECKLTSACVWPVLNTVLKVDLKSVAESCTIVRILFHLILTVKSIYGIRF
jgi:hypothetical protein